MKTSLAPGGRLSLTIDKPAAGGRMIARHDGQVILVSGAIPGERVEAVVERVGKGVAYAWTETVAESSPDRRTDGGDPSCGGCLYAFIAYPRQLALKAAIIGDAFARIGRVALPGEVAVASSPEQSYRMRARLHVRGTRIGFFREETHDLCDARQTRQLLPAACDVLDRVAAACCAAGGADVREIELAENVDGSERVLFLEGSAEIDARLLAAIEAGGDLTGIGSAAVTVGATHVTDRLDLGAVGSVTLSRHVRAFFQGNRYLLSPLVRHVVGLLPTGDVLDLYAGGGLFSLAAAAGRSGRVTAVEGDRISAADLRRNAATAGGLVVAVHESVEAFTATRGFTAACAIVDPPRTGLSREALDGVVRGRLPRIVYVSCDVATLARDTRRLLDAGYTLTRVDAFDLFPNTPHVETVAVFDR